MENSYTNGLSYVPYASKRHSRTVSLNSEDPEVNIAESSSPKLRPSLPVPSTSAAAVVVPNNKPADPAFSSRGTSTFRRIGPRPSHPPAPSPLRTNAQSPSLTANSVALPPPESRPLSAVPPPGEPQKVEHRAARITSPPSPVPPVNEPSVLRNVVQSPAISPAPVTVPLPEPPFAPRSSRTSPAPPLESRSSLSSLSTPEPPSSHRAAPYRPGFQPKGVYRHRTEDFLAIRDSKSSKGKAEERRIERRLEKLVELHYPVETVAAIRPTSSKRPSSLFDLSELKGKSPADLFRGVIEAKTGSPSAIRAAEQIITPWQVDTAASSCPMCNTSFHSLTNRKHHCRLCGRVVCALPPKKPNRLRPCSLLISVDRKTWRITPIAETIAYGVSRPSSGTSTPASSTAQDTQPHGIRVCCECNVIIARQDFLNESRRSSPFTRLYDIFIQTEAEIETSLGTLEALLPSISLSSASPEVLGIRKQLSSLFTDYDTAAKRIRALPCSPDSSQHRVQQAVWNRAVNFMQMHMGILQRMPKPPSTHKHSKSSSSQTSLPLDPEKIVIEDDSALAHSLQPLLEQEALLESFVLEANQQRKFEDVKSLKANLAEIRGEISRIVTRSGTTR